MNKKLKIITSIFSLALAFAVFATPSKGKAADGNDFKLPEKARKVNNNLYYLGQARDLNGRKVEGYAFLRRREPEVKPPWAGGNKDSGPTCYGYLADGAKWRSSEPWEVNPDISGIGSSFVLSNLENNIGKWENAAKNISILGDGSLTSEVLVADTDSPDGYNEVYFDKIADSNTIAVTIVWGYFSGRPSWRELVEWDQIYNTDYAWSESGESGKMDFENISTHELGHTFGMDDIYDLGCSDVTMFGYAGLGETDKSSLEQADKDGVFGLYN